MELLCGTDDDNRIVYLEEFAIGGNNWDPTRLKWNSKTTSPVTAHPTGASLYGCLDMSGNAWKWCKEFKPETHTSVKNAPRRQAPNPRAMFYEEGITNIDFQVATEQPSASKWTLETDIPTLAAESQRHGNWPFCGDSA